MRHQYIRMGQGFLLCYAVTSRETFEAAQQFRDQIFRVKDVTKVTN